MKGITELKLDKKEAAEKYELYKTTLEERFQGKKEGLAQEIQQAYRDLMRAYGHMRHGRAIIHIRQAFRDAGFDEDGWPRIAIARVNHRQSFCARNRLGRVVLSGTDFNTTRWGAVQMYVRPEDVDLGPGFQTENTPSAYIVARTEAPVVPPHLLPEDGLEDCYVLWEAEEWSIHRVPKVRPIPRDPMLLSRVNATIFVVLATWEMTELERTILSGRIG